MLDMIASPETVARMAFEGRKKAERLFDVNKVNAKICETMGI